MYTQPIALYNPLPEPIQVLEVFSSSPKLQLHVEQSPSSHMDTPEQAVSTATEKVSWTLMS